MWMPGSADVVIVGGAVMGSAVACALARHPALAGRRIVVIERDMSYRACATTRSAGGIRQQFSTPECIRMSQATLDLIRDMPPDMTVDMPPDMSGCDTPDMPRMPPGRAAALDCAGLLAFREQGYLLLASETGRGILSANVALQRSLAADVALLSPAQLQARLPWIASDGIAAAALGLSGEGWIDPACLLALFRTTARSRGATYIAGEVAAIEMSRSRIAAARLVDGRRIACGALVNAAGPAAGRVARMAGVALPVEPRKRFVFVVHCRDAPAELLRAPLTVDTSGVWFRPEGGQFICGVSPATEAEEPSPGDLDAVDHALFEARIWPALAARVPAFAALKVVGAWAGHYDMNTFDHNAVIGPHPDIANLHFCCGFSGHGLQHAAAAGRAVAERIAEGAFRTLDLSRLGFARLLRGEPLLECNVI